MANNKKQVKGLPPKINDEITYADVLIWIVENSDNFEVMDKINQLTFPFTSKYKRWTDKNE